VVYIYTENFFLKNRLKNRAKVFLGGLLGGPKAVERNLILGLKELGEEVLVNKKIGKPIPAIGVISGERTLKWAIAQKQKGKIKKIVTGPNIAVFPRDHGGVLLNPLIDAITVPSQWSKDLYVKLAPELAKKIILWPVGVAVPPQSRANKIFDFLVFDKIGDNPLRAEIEGYLKSQNRSYRVLVYGKFRQEEYFNLLEQSRFEIYLSESESQGLAMFEAWARDVPTLVWERGYFEYRGQRLEANAASPHLVPQAGMRFKNFSEFKDVLAKFEQAEYSPREYIINNFSNRICSGNYLKILNADYV
jgi:hypothetical protein